MSERLHLTHRSVTQYPKGTMVGLMSGLIHTTITQYTVGTVTHLTTGLLHLVHSKEGTEVRSLQGSITVPNATSNPLVSGCNSQPTTEWLVVVS